MATIKTEPVIEKLPLGSMEVNCYILSLPEGKDCLLVDPGTEAETIRAALRGRAVAGVLLTHGHFDHIGAVDGITPENAPLYIHSRDTDMLYDPRGNLSSMIGAPFALRHKAISIEEGETLSLAGMEIEVLHTPGHTEGSLCYRMGNHLLSGDTLFYRGYGRTDLPGGSWEALYESLKRLMRLPEDVVVYPGHGQNTTIAECKGGPSWK